MIILVTLSGGCVETLSWKIRVGHHFPDGLHMKQVFRMSGGKRPVLENYPKG
jgi:hypothetical protein